jgi:hypothetical protein
MVADATSRPSVPKGADQRMNEVRGEGRVIAAVYLLMIAGVLNVIYGIAGISRSNVFAGHSHYIFGDLRTWGWVILILGILELCASVSLGRGARFGIWFAITVGALNAIEALLSIPAYPIWALAIFGLSIWIVWGLAQFAADT